MIVNVYQRYFEAELEYNGTSRRGASVMLISDSEAGNIKYTVSVAFMPHEDENDFRVPYDACFSKVLYEGKGRRSKKREKEFLDMLPQCIEELSASAGGKVYIEKPLTEERLG